MAESILVQLAALIIVTAAGGVAWSLAGFIRNAVQKGDAIDFKAIGKNVFIGALIGVIAGVYSVSVGETFSVETLQDVGVWFFVGFDGAIIFDKVIIPLATQRRGVPTSSTPA